MTGRDNALPSLFLCKRININSKFMPLNVKQVLRGLFSPKSKNLGFAYKPIIIAEFQRKRLINITVGFTLKKIFICFEQ